LWARITADDEELVMPPPSSHKKLTSDQIDLLRRWIEQGASYQNHWSFEPPVAREIPPSDPAFSNPIDAFINAELRQRGWSLAESADKTHLIRRVAFTLTGLPPTAEQTVAYLEDNSPDAYEKMVDRFLASPHFGEEMARHWLDLARYGDTHGLHLDNERQMWAYRDWVVNAFNRNLPFDQFTIEQLAGDLLPNPTMDQLVATGFNRCNVTTSEGGAIDAEFYYRYAVDRTSTTVQTWMGLTAGCAVCHDHKFDPISAKEFYSLYAFFNSSADPAMDGNALLTNPILKLATPEHEQKLAEFDRTLQSQQQAVETQAAQVKYVDPATLEPPLPATTSEHIWLDDAFPEQGRTSGSPGHPTQFVGSEAGVPVFSGERVLKRTDAGLTQDVWEQAATPLAIPNQGKIFVEVWLDPKNPPTAIMLQFHKSGWLHRAVWGDVDAIQWGEKNTTQRAAMGPLPELGQWVHLEFPVDRVGLVAGDAITGFALTQFGGTVYWDRLGVAGISDPANDPSRSFVAWWRAAKTQPPPGLPGELKSILDRGPPESKTGLQESPAGESVSPDVGGAQLAGDLPVANDTPPVVSAPVWDEDALRLQRFYLQYVCADTKPQFAPLLQAIQKTKEERQAFDQSIPRTFIYRESERPRESFVMLRGQYNQPGDKVTPDVPAVFPRLMAIDKAQPNRLDLARWLVSDENPLTARVIVNRYWQQVFGMGLVKTSGDFGSQGETPSHPELLDWLAVHFRGTGWDLKSLLRLMLTSQTFRQHSRVDPVRYAADPENRWLARGPRMRLSAEQIRDNALFVSGLMSLKMGGPGVRPYQPANVWEPVGYIDSNTRNYRQDNGEALYRRSLYTFFKRTAPPPFMANFDAPNREQSCTVRERSNTPLQALQLMNDVQHIEAARVWAERVMEQQEASFADKVQWMYRQLLSRTAQDREITILKQQWQTHLERYQTREADARQLISQGERPPRADLNVAELAAWTMLANTLFNLDETLNRN
jgi:lambda repressor-like predicted transcriptional regulator